MRLVVVGGVAAGTKAASRAKRVAPEVEVVLYQEEPEVSISECGMPYFISGIVKDRERLVARTPEQFAKKEIEVKVRHRVESFDPEGKKLTVRDLENDETFEDSFDRLIIATGARSIPLPIPGADLGGVFGLRFLTDADLIKSYIADRSPERAVVIGGGYIGLEMAENLKRLGMEVAVIEAGERLAPAYGVEVAGIISNHLGKNGVEVFAGDPAGGLSCEGGPGEDCVKAVRFGEKEIAADLVIVGIGVRPVVTLAEEAGAKIGPTGAIVVDEAMRTSLPDVWAAGDCAETKNLITGRPAWLPLGDTANKMGRVAGTNAVGDSEDPLRFPGVLGTGIFKVFDLGVGKTGLSEEEAKDAGFEPLCASVEAKSRAGYFPGAEDVFFKLIVDRKTGRVLGAETVGGGVDKLTDVSATAIWGELSCHDLINIDLAYAPPFGPTLSPIIQAATIISGKRCA